MIQYDGYGNVEYYEPKAPPVEKIEDRRVFFIDVKDFSQEQVVATLNEVLLKFDQKPYTKQKWYEFLGYV